MQRATLDPLGAFLRPTTTLLGLAALALLTSFPAAAHAQETPAPSSNEVSQQAQTLLPWEIPLRKSGIGALAGLHIDMESGGSAGFIAGSLAIDSWLDLMAGAVVGKHSAGYLGARIFTMEEDLAPVVSAGLVSFFTNPSDVGLRVGGGLAWSPHERISVIAELAVELYPRSSYTYKRKLYVPSLVVEGRL